MYTNAHSTYWWLFQTGNDLYILPQKVWFIKGWYIHSVEHYSIIKRNELLICLLGLISRDIDWVGKKKPASDYILYDFIIHIKFFCLGLHLWHMEVPRRGSNWRFLCWPYAIATATPIWVASVTYTSACSSAGSLAHWARPGMEPAPSQRLRQVLKALIHSGNSQLYTLKGWILWWVIFQRSFKISDLGGGGIHWGFGMEML